MNGFWREYHEATKHTPERLRASARVLDWANMPDPFRHYEGVPVVDLPADPELREGLTGGAGWLSSLFLHSCAISATKVAPSGMRYALRVNPSSGNLHPTEVHFAARGVRGWPDGVYHYRASSHMAEQRGVGDFVGEWSDAPVVVLLSSIAWREVWKYGARAYRYVHHDIGHAWESLAQAAFALGARVRARGLFDDAAMAERFGLAEDEWPVLALEIWGAPLETRAEVQKEWFGGVPNAISVREERIELIETVHSAGRHVGEGAGPAMPAVRGRSLAEVARRRRSALDFVGGERRIRLEELEALLGWAGQGFAADWEGRFVRLWLYVHRVEGLAPGIYDDGLKMVREGDQRVAAAGLSLGQDLAGNACVAFSLVADLERATDLYGDRGYRMAHWEAGLIGQRMYLAATAMGFGATGIGAFFDDRVREYLGLEQGEVVYHFACGYPVVDPRLAG